MGLQSLDTEGVRLLSMRGFDGDNWRRMFVNYCTRRNLDPAKECVMAHVEFRGLIRLATLAGLALAVPALATAQTAKPTPTFTKEVAPYLPGQM